ALIELEGAEAEEGEEKRMDLPSLLRDVHRFAETPGRLGELPERQERDGKHGPHDRPLGTGPTESLLRQGLWDQREPGLAVPDGLAVFASRDIHLAHTVVGDHLDGDVRLRLADGQGATPGVERRGVVAALRELDDLEVQRAAEAALV